MSKQQTGVAPLDEKAALLLLGVQEDQGYEVPFANFSWEEWQQMQAHMLQCFTRFQRAIHYKQANVAIQIAREVIKMGMDWVDEATIWIEKHP